MTNYNIKIGKRGKFAFLMKSGSVKDRKSWKQNRRFEIA